MKVLKFGGTSVGSKEGINKIVQIVRKERRDDDNFLLVVVSAFSGVTNQLIKLGQDAEKDCEDFISTYEKIKKRHLEMIDILFPDNLGNEVTLKVNNLLEECKKVALGINLIHDLSKKTLDYLMSFGERLSALIITKYFQSIGIQAEYLDARNIIKTDKNFGSANVLKDITQKEVEEYFKNKKSIIIMTGFIGSTLDNETTTFGRGASDFTASLMGNLLNAEEIQIWSDVDGVMTANPKKVPNAFTIEELTYEEAMELSHFGTKVLYPPTVKPAKEKNIPIRLLNTFNPENKGTIVKNIANCSKYKIRGITSIDDVALIRVEGSGMVGVTGISSRLFKSLALAKINVIMIIQASSEHSICIAINPDKANLAKESIDEEFKFEIQAGLIDQTIIEKGYSIIAVVGENMRKTLGIAGSLFSSLGRNGVNVVTIAQGSSELNISLVVSQKDETKALNAIHEAFFRADEKCVNLFIMGVGNIGSVLLKMINDLNKRKDVNPRLNVIGIARRSKMLFNITGIDLDNWEKELEKSNIESSIDDFLNTMYSYDLPYSIFVDNTASKEVSNKYKEIVTKSISIVTPNKIFNVGNYSDYIELRQLLRKYKNYFFYETTVGAGLPVINTLNDLLISGDVIIKIEGVLSGTISYIFNTFNESKRFSDIVIEAMKKGYTEPDPRLDLNGLDIARKLLTLVRELGVKMELDDIKINKLLPDEYYNTPSIDSFLEKLKEYDSYFHSLFVKAKNDGKALRYIASYENGKASVDLKFVDKNSPFYSINGSENIISFTTNRYFYTPLVVRGPGAGSEVTSAGVLADIIKTSKLILKD